MLQLSSYEKLIHELTSLPGIGPKSAQRLAYFILRSPRENMDRLCESLHEVKERIRTCSLCFNFTQNEKHCCICESPYREKNLLCIVEEPSDILQIEASGVFKGYYHVLHGVISLLEGVLPQNLKIEDLLTRLNAPSSEVKEIIFALDADLEGDTTILYLSDLLQNRNIKISRIAHGIPMGSDIDYIDKRTMGRAIENRVEL